MILIVAVKKQTPGGVCFLLIQEKSMLLPVGIHLRQVLEGAIENGFSNRLPGSVKLGMRLTVFAGIAHHQQSHDLQILRDAEPLPQQRRPASAQSL